MTRDITERKNLTVSVFPMCRRIANSCALSETMREDLEQELRLLAWKKSAMHDPSKGKFSTFFWALAWRRATYFRFRNAHDVSLSRQEYARAKAGESVSVRYKAIDLAREAHPDASPDELVDFKKQVRALVLEVENLKPTLNSVELLVLDAILEDLPVGAELQRATGKSRAWLHNIKHSLFCRLATALREGKT